MSDLTQWIVGTGFSRGIGFELSKQMRKRNYKIFHVGRTQSGQEDEFFSCDLVKPLSLKSFKLLHSQLKNKNTHGFFYGAGIFPSLSIVKDSIKERKKFWKSQLNAMQVNYFSFAQLMPELLHLILNSVQNNVHNSIPFLAHISSLAGVDPLPGFELYGITKAAALKYFANLAKEFSPNRLSCLSVHPGTVKTDMLFDLMKIPEYKNLPVIDILKREMEENRVISPMESAQLISEFLFEKTFSDKRKSAHGKLYDVYNKKITKI